MESYTVYKHSTGYLVSQDKEAFRLIPIEDLEWTETVKHTTLDKSILISKAKEQRLSKRTF